MMDENNRGYELYKLFKKYGYITDEKVGQDDYLAFRIETINKLCTISGEYSISNNYGSLEWKFNENSPQYETFKESTNLDGIWIKSHKDSQYEAATTLSRLYHFIDDQDKSNLLEEDVVAFKHQLISTIGKVFY